MAGATPQFLLGRLAGSIQEDVGQAEFELCRQPGSSYLFRLGRYTDQVDRRGAICLPVQATPTRRKLDARQSGASEATDCGRQNDTRRSRAIAGRFVNVVMHRATAVEQGQVRPLAHVH